MRKTITILLAVFVVADMLSASTVRRPTPEWVKSIFDTGITEFKITLTYDLTADCAISNVALKNFEPDHARGLVSTADLRAYLKEILGPFDERVLPSVPDYFWETGRPSPLLRQVRVGNVICSMLRGAITKRELCRETCIEISEDHPIFGPKIYMFSFKSDAA